MWEQERLDLLPLPAHPFPCCRTVPVRPNRLSMVTFQTNRYSVPVECADGTLLLRAFVNRVEITDGTRVVAIHERCYGREQDILDVFHYLPLLKQRPGAFDHLARLRERLSHRAATLEFLHVMDLCVTHSLDEVAAAVEQAMTLGSLGVNTVAYLLRANRTPREPAAVLASAPACPQVLDRDLSQYDRFIRR